MTTHGQQGGEAQHRHEKRDLRVSYVGVFFIGLFLLIAAGLLVSWGVFDLLLSRRAATDTPPPPLAITRPNRPPEPRLQVNPPLELDEIRGEEEAQLNSYGWVQKEAGVVRIPIEHAKELLLERGLPVRPQPADRDEGRGNE
jgi:hypothetical protein